jgi:hypothetical protein
MSGTESGSLGDFDSQEHEHIEVATRDAGTKPLISVR